MNRAAAWSVRGVGRETRDIAEEAARRAGMSLGDWLDEVVAEQAADQGVSVDDLDEDDKLDAIGDRLSRLSRHPAAVRRDAGEEARAPRPERKPSGEEARRTQDLPKTAEDERDDDKLDAIANRLSRLSSRAIAANRPGAGNEAPEPRPEPKSSAEEARREQELLEAAVAKFETRTAKSEERTAKAFELVASWIEQSQADRAQERATLQSVAQKLTDIEQRSVREVERPPAAPSGVAARGEDTAADIDKRLSALARRVAAPQQPRGEYRRGDERPRIDVRDSVAQIARRQTELDSRETSGRPSATASGVLRDFGADPKLRASGPQAPPTVEHSTAEGVKVASTEETLRKEIAALTARVARLRADDAGQTSSPAVAEDLRAGLAAMSRSLAALAPRNASVALEGAVGDFGQRLDAARKAGASDRLVALVESMLDQGARNASQTRPAERGRRARKGNSRAGRESRSSCAHDGQSRGLRATSQPNGGSAQPSRRKPPCALSRSSGWRGRSRSSPIASNAWPRARRRTPTPRASSKRFPRRVRKSNARPPRRL